MKKAIFLISLTLLCIKANAQWTALNSGSTKSLTSAHFISDNVGCVTGYTGTLLRTDDGGASWTSITTGTTENLNSVFFPTNAVGYVVGNLGTIMKTTDGGLSWSALSSGISENLLDVYFLTADLGWAVGYSKTILQTTDGGLNWSIYGANIQNSFNWYAVYPIDNSTVMVGGNFQSFAITNDAGTNWSESRLGSQQGKMCCALVAFNFIDNNLGFAITNKSDLLKTVDGGNNWTILDSTRFAFRDLNGIDFTSAMNGWVVGDSIYNTIDGGLSWNAQINPTSNKLHDVFFSGSTTGYAVGGGGTILKTSNGGTAGIAENNEKQSSFTVFPNPAFQDVNLEVKMKKAGEISLSLSDLSGKTIMELSDESNSYGTYSHTIERGNFPGGIYLLTIQTDSEKWVRKISFAE